MTAPEHDEHGEPVDQPPVSEAASRVLLLVRTLRLWRRMFELSQRALAERAGIGEKHLGEIERGKRDPHLSTLMRLVVALDLSDEELVAFWEEAVGIRPSLSRR